MNSEVKKMMNQQINSELESAYLYLEFANYFTDSNLDGYANYYQVQAKEEINHAMLFYNYLHMQKEKIKLLIIKEPQSNFNSIEEILKEGLKAECSISKMINNIYECAEKNKDYASLSFLKWFVDEQLEEESNSQKMIDDYKMFQDNLYELNEKYSKRVFERKDVKS